LADLHHSADIVCGCQLVSAKFTVIFTVATADNISVCSASFLGSFCR